MRRYFAVTKALLINNIDFLSMDKEKKKGGIKKILFYLALVLAFLPTSIAIAVFVSLLYDLLAAANQSGLILGIALNMVSTIVFIFGIFFTINIFYFSKDIEGLLYLPVEPSEILCSKLTLTLVYEYITEFIILIPVLISFGIKSGGGILYWLFCLIIFLLLPIIPLTYSSIITTVLMRFTNLAKNKDRLRVIVGIAAILIALGSNIYIQRFTRAIELPELTRDIVTQGNNSLLNSMTSLFPANKYAALSIINNGSVNGLINLIIYLSLTIALIFVFVFIGERLYFTGVVGMGEAPVKRKKVDFKNYNSQFKKRSVLTAYATKELRILFRTPTYFLNCILMTIIWPLFAAAVMLSYQSTLTELSKLNSFISEKTIAGLIISIVFAISLVTSSSNCITSTAVSREGHNIFFTKMIPLRYGDQIMAKVIPGIVMGIAGQSIVLVLALFFIEIPIYIFIVSAFVSILGICFTSFTGIIIDLNFPKLLWDNEQKAVKQNLNAVINIFIALLIAAASVYTTIWLNLNIWIVFWTITIVFGGINIGLYLIVIRIGSKIYSKIEIG